MKKSKEDLHLHKKKVQSENSIWHLFCSESWRGRVYLKNRSDTTKLLPQKLHSGLQHQATMALNGVCEHLCFIPIYYVHSLARYVLKYQKSLREIIFPLFYLREGGGNNKKISHIN